MRKARSQADSAEKETGLRPALSPEARENQLIVLATNLAEKQLREGTASSQVITHYLKMGSSKERAELEVLRKQVELLEAKTKNINDAKQSGELYEKAIQAMRSYSGKEELGDDSDV